MQRVKPINHYGKQLLLLDFSGARKEDFPVALEEAEKSIRNQPLNSVLTLTDVSGARYNEEIVQTIKEFTKGNKPFVKAAAVVGLDGLKKIICSTVMLFSQRNLKAFDDIEKAKDWLSQQ